uniref:Uncharacterized protein n=1 Tax=virus sp. ctx9V1 TaxID=2828001 RepID=A0A8S5RDH1_9VIRU|nr:MAG TPA: hypothetical protein [virus sp. ctx9V1]
MKLIRSKIGYECLLAICRKLHPMKLELEYKNSSIRNSAY